MDGEYTERPLIIAGGAGGSAGPHGAVQYTTTDASLSPNGKDGYQSTANVGNGGTNGNGGNRGYRLTGNNVPGGGAGFRGDGVKSSDNRFEPRPTAAVAVKRNNQENVNPPGSGGTYNYNGVPYDGGFGGGGSGARNAPGGAGGYSGGGGANLDGHSGGGGSFKDGERVGNYRIEANNIGAGEVRIEYLGESLIINQEIRDEQTS
uniref:Uncharacterized protein n=1 Tax=Ciona savignyi TaxID=51511 RepID=H2YD58_CIOSA